MTQEITYYPPDADAIFIEDLHKIGAQRYQMPGRKQLNVALAAAVVAIIMAVVLGYFAFTMQDQNTPNNANQQSQVINDNS